MTSPNFRSISAPLDISDEQLATINRSMGVPTLVPPAAPALKPTEDTKALNLRFPRYLTREIKRRAFEGETSEKYVVMKALLDAGFQIDPADLVKDGRTIR